MSDELLSAWLDDELSPSERAEVDRLLEQHAELRQLLDELRALRARLQSLPVREPDERLTARIMQGAAVVARDRARAWQESEGGCAVAGFVGSTDATPVDEVGGGTGAVEGPAPLVVSSRFPWRRALGIGGALAASVLLVLVLWNRGDRELARHDLHLDVTDVTPRGSSRGLTELERTSSEMFMGRDVSREALLGTPKGGAEAPLQLAEDQYPTDRSATTADSRAANEKKSPADSASLADLPATLQAPAGPLAPAGPDDLRGMRRSQAGEGGRQVDDGNLASRVPPGAATRPAPDGLVRQRLAGEPAELELTPPRIAMGSAMSRGSTPAPAPTPAREVLSTADQLFAQLDRQQLNVVSLQVAPAALEAAGVHRALQNNRIQLSREVEESAERAKQFNYYALPELESNTATLYYIEATPEQVRGLLRELDESGQVVAGKLQKQAELDAFFKRDLAEGAPPVADAKPGGRAASNGQDELRADAATPPSAAPLAATTAEAAGAAQAASPRFQDDAGTRGRAVRLNVQQLSKEDKAGLELQRKEQVQEEDLVRGENRKLAEPGNYRLLMILQSPPQPASEVPRDAADNPPPR